MDFDKESDRFGTGQFSEERDQSREGLFDGRGVRFGYSDSARPLSLDTDAPLLTVSGSGGGKTSQILIPEVLSNPAQNRAGNDLRGEIIKSALPALAAEGVYAWIWNPTGMLGLASHAIQGLEILRLDSPTFHPDCDFLTASIIPTPAGQKEKYFILKAQEWLKNIKKALVERDGFVSFPSLWHTVNLIDGDRNAWADFAEIMFNSNMDGVRRTAGEMVSKQLDSPREFGGIVGEITAHLNFLDDPALQGSLENASFSLADICNQDHPVSIFFVIPVEFIATWAALIRVFYSVLMLYKSRAPSAPRIQFLVDEASQLKRFDALERAVTFGRGQGISTWNFFQDLGQVSNHYGQAGLQTFMGSSVLRQFFGVRDYETAKMVSDMLGNETLEFDDTLKQEAARRDRVNAAMDFLHGNDPMRVLNNMRSHRFAENHRSKQARRLMTPDEVLAMPEDRQISFISGKNLRPLYARKRPYYECREFAGKYLPNPYYGPTDRVNIATMWGQRTRRVIREPVPPEFAHLPQYESGMWEYVEGFRPKLKRRR